MERVLFVAVGGGAGAVLRYFTGVLSKRWLGIDWPYGTFAVNVLGGFAMGMLVGWLALKGGADQDRWRLLLGVGVLGGFTTFSAFSLETALMLERREYAAAVVYVGLSVALSIGALFAGLLLMRKTLA
jgi:CrcB protein